ncbi:MULTISPECIES: sigma-70 family RNA polymerase sigma factor [Vagococcus]|uniref:DNA-directed RNA polymerase specialized sigma subunit, sigma24-like n=1 Tax=Vagococcus fluvialis bH819 TaxID=1255619 RepID=A0A1X6WLP0_9ENTE|nr:MULTISPECIES: sigma-70 family RNA polymerase sigma factor [Vagococcus]SLM85180.1 DNA-directed RNA polymerase specialized sigma subunit, sigma24-like [Vagococcus fluvialis bH819]
MEEKEVILNRAKLGCNDSFEVVFNQYIPVVLKQRNLYYLRDLDLDDWLQEGRLVCYQSLLKYDSSKNVTFGLFFKMNFNRHIISLLRHQEAQKRRIYRYTDSLDSKMNSFGECISRGTEDYRADTSIKYIYVRESLEKLPEQLSKFEQKVYHYTLSGMSIEEISDITDISQRKILFGYNRLKVKLKKQIL